MERAISVADREACFKRFSKLMDEDPDLDPEVNSELSVPISQSLMDDEKTGPVPSSSYLENIFAGASPTPVQLEVGCFDEVI